MELGGIHHVSALTADAPGNVRFYTRGLGMRLVKKTVNQDDPYSYHLFYGDERGTPGTELTFFHIPSLAPNRPGRRSISALGLRVADEGALAYHAARLEERGLAAGPVREVFGRPCLPFRDPEGQNLLLVADDGSGVAGGTPWGASPVPVRHAVIGLGPVFLTVADRGATVRTLVEVLGFREAGVYRFEGEERVVLACGPGGPGAEVHVAARPDLPPERLGRGGVHHVAFRVATREEQEAWLDRVERAGLRTSGLVERHYFRSVYFREPGGVLYELATDGPGFLVDEDLAHLGERLALPPFLEPYRAAIEAHLEPLETRLPIRE